MVYRIIPDVCPAFRRRKSRPMSPDLEAAEGEGSSHHRLVHQTVPGICDACQKKNPDLSQVVPENKEDERTSRIGHQRCESMQFPRIETKFQIKIIHTVPM